MRVNLTAMAIEKLPHPTAGQVKYWDTVVPGFGVRVTARSKTFFVSYGKERRSKTIGQYPATSLKTARDEAKLFQTTQKPHHRIATVSEARAAFLADAKNRLGRSTYDQYERYLSRCDVKHLDKEKRTSMDLTHPHTVAAWKAFMNWCVREELIDRNPFFKIPAVNGQRDRVLTDAEVKAIWHYDHKPYSDLLKLLLLTGQRRNQFWQYDPAWRTGDIITFPVTIMKSGRPHTIPVTGYQTYLQTFTMNGWSKQKVRIDKHTGVTDWVLHDFRRYFSTTMARLGTPLHLTEHILDHRSSISGVAAIYNRYGFIEEMRFALDKYHAHIQSIVS